MVCPYRVVVALLTVALGCMISLDLVRLVTLCLRSFSRAWVCLFPWEELFLFLCVSFFFDAGADAQGGQCVRREEKGMERQRNGVQDGLRGRDRHADRLSSGAVFRRLLLQAPLCQSALSRLISLPLVPLLDVKLTWILFRLRPRR
jgi:hypothetical protein